VAHETRFKVLPFSVGVLPHPCLSTLLWICTALFAFHVQLKGAAGAALWSWHSISETHLLFSEFPVLFLSILPPFGPSLSLSYLITTTPSFLPSSQELLLQLPLSLWENGQLSKLHFLSQKQTSTHFFALSASAFKLKPSEIHG
jgi:hypothetical protein